MNKNEQATANAKLLTPAAVAALLGIKAQSLRVRRMRGAGPPFVRLGNTPTSRCAYREEDVFRWINERPSYIGTCEEKAARARKQG